MLIKNSDHIDIIGGNISGLTLALELLDKKVPFTLHEKQIWNKPCGGGYGLVLKNYLRTKNISVPYNNVKTATFGNQYFNIENLPFDVQVAKRSQIQEEIMYAIPQEFIKMEQVTKESVKDLSKLLVVATGINGFTKYLMQKEFTNLGRYQYCYFNDETMKGWDFEHMFWYVIPEIKGYAWIFPSTEGDIDVGIGGLKSDHQELYFNRFLAHVQKKYGVKIKRDNSNKRLRSWGIPMWDNKKPKKVFTVNKEINKYCVAIGDAAEAAQIVSAGGIENALLTSISLANSLTVENSTILFDLDTYQHALTTKLPLPSHPITMQMIDKITKSKMLFDPMFAFTVAAFPIMYKLFGRIFYLE